MRICQFCGHAALTDTQNQILRLALEGYTTRGIAKATGISTETVRWHFKNIYPALGVHSRAEAVEAAREMVA